MTRDRAVHHAGRALRLLGLPLGTAALAAEGAVRRRLLGHDDEIVRRDLRQRNAARTRRVLGDQGRGAEGGPAAGDARRPVPDRPRRHLAADAGRRARAQHGGRVRAARAGLTHELGPGWRDRFASFDERFAAAASIGQVHRAVWHDGRAVAVKIQYPDVAAALRSDLRVVSLMTRAAALVAPGLALPPLVAEMRVRLADELDYVAEADAQRAFADAYRDDPDIVIPEVVLATPRVLVTEWLHATPFVMVAAQGTQARRNRAAELYMRFLLAGPERVGRLHTDPHPGNFRLTDTGQLGVLDFGSTLAMPEGMPKTFGRLLTVLRRGDTDEILAGLRDEGFVRPGADVDAAKLRDYLAPFTVPAGHETFTFTRDWLRTMFSGRRSDERFVEPGSANFSRTNDPRNPEFAVALQLTMPPEHLFTHRVWLGCVGVLCQLGATVAVRPVIERWLPGFDAA